MTTVPCPSDLALEQYLLGELSPSQAHVGQHVAACEACRRKVADKTADNDAFVSSPAAEAIRGALASHGPARPMSTPGAPPTAPAPSPAPDAPRRRMFAALAFAAVLVVAFLSTLRRPSSVAPAPSARPTPASSAAAHTHEEEIVLRVQREWMEATRDNDVAALERILADDYTYTDSRGRVSNKADSLRYARAARNHMKAFYTSDEKARVYGDVAIVTGRMRVEGVAGGEPYDAEVRFTDILARVDGQWRAVAAHASRPNERPTP